MASLRSLQHDPNSVSSVFRKGIFMSLVAQTIEMPMLLPSPAYAVFCVLHDDTGGDKLGANRV
jgi:hypothetical protein